MFSERFDGAGAQTQERSLKGSGRWVKAIFAVLLSALLSIGVCKYVDMAFADEGSAQSQGTVFKGEVSGDSGFATQGVVKLNLQYKYSNTGGLAGIDVAPPQTIEAIAEKQADGTYKVTWNLPTKDGFRIVLDPAELNKYVKKPPTGKETPEELSAALENGDFDVDIENHTVYYYQQVKGQETNPTYGNRYSDVYNEAWNAARWVEVKGDQGYRAEAVSSQGNPGANALKDPKLEVTLTEAQLKNAQENGVGITVNYRRNVTWYNVNHWVPESLSGLSTDAINNLPTDEKKTVGEGADAVNYVRLDQDTLQGRVGASTRAVARTSTAKEGIGNPYELLSAAGFNQKLIENTGTAVDIYYSASDSYRVIFDTDYTYIPRQ